MTHRIDFAKNVFHFNGPPNAVGDRTNRFRKIIDPIASSVRTRNTAQIQYGFFDHETIRFSHLIDNFKHPLVHRVLDDYVVFKRQRFIVARRHRCDRVTLICALVVQTFDVVEYLKRTITIERLHDHRFS